jgi:hypothetical protein
MHSIRHDVALVALSLLAAGGCDLRCNGPTTVMSTDIKYGGRAVAIATNPGDDKAAFVVSESGGIFRTQNFGSPWFQVTKANTFWFSDVSYMRGNSDIIIATAFKDLKVANSGGVWRSTNGGDTWTHVAITPPDTLRPFEAYGIAMEPSEPPRIWVGTSRGLAFSDDQGATWAFIPRLANFIHDPVWAVVAPSAGHIRVLTSHGFRSSDDRGATWLQPTQGLLPIPFYATHNQLACSPSHDNVVYWCGTVGNDSLGYSTILTRTTDAGTNWTKILQHQVQNRDSFIRVTPRALSSADTYQIYFGDGSSYLGRADITQGDDKIGSWQTLSVEHVDCSDIGFKDDGFTPWLLAGDGGLQTTTDKGAHWKMAGNGKDGYAALQVSDAVGQVHDKDRESDFYFGTQDNDFWASGDNGRTWPHSTPVEGMHLNVGEHATGGEGNRVNFINHLADYIANPLLANGVWMNVPSGDGMGARRLGEKTYLRAVRGVTPGGGDPLWVSQNNGAFWITRSSAPGFVETRDRQKVIDRGTGQLVYSAVHLGQNNEVILRASDLVGNGTPVFSAVSGFGHLAFAQARAPSTWNPPVWEALYSVDPFDPDHLLVVDDQAGQIKVTHDGGASWAVDQNLMSRITNRGTYKFQATPGSSMTQVTVIAFDPHTRGRILVGTVQSGVIFSCNFGQTWQRLEDSENIPNVSSFTFTGEGWVLASSYGRGLWRLRIDCPKDEQPPPILERTAGGPFLYSGGALFPLGSLEPEPQFSFAVARGGNISGYDADKAGSIQSIGVTAGTVVGLTMSAKDTSLAVSSAPSAPRRRPESDPKLAGLMKEGFQVKGICLEGRQFKGYVLAKEEIAPADLPEARVPGPALAVALSGDELRRFATVTGARFEPGVALQVSVNDNVLHLSATAGRDGGFQFGIPVPPPAGPLRAHGAAGRRPRTGGGVGAVRSDDEGSGSRFDEVRRRGRPVDKPAAIAHP